MASRFLTRRIFSRFGTIFRPYHTDGSTGNTNGTTTTTTTGGIPIGSMRFDNPDSSSNYRAITEHSVEVNGAEIFYSKTGSGKHTVLLVPGALGGANTDFLPQLQNINKDIFTLIAFDPRGYGRSKVSPREWKRNFLESDAADAAKLMQILKYDKFSLLGWSDGGITSLILAAHYPHRVKKAVVWGANAFLTKEEVAFYESIRDIAKWSERMREPFIDMYGEKEFQEMWSLWIDNFSNFLRDNDGNICKHELSKITCPVLVLHGNKDPVVPEMHADYIKEHIRNSKKVNFAEGKHNLHLNFFKEFNALVEQFLVELPGTTVGGNIYVTA